MSKCNCELSEIACAGFCDEKCCPPKPTDQKPIWEDRFSTLDDYIEGDNIHDHKRSKDLIRDFIKEVETAAEERGYSDGISYYINKYKIVEPSNGLETYWEQLESSVNTPEENWYEMGRKLKK